MKKRTGFDTMSPYLYPFYICLHPRDGFLELKANKKGSTTVVLITVLAWLFVELFYRVATGFDMNQFNPADTSLIRVAVTTVMMFVMVCLSNWCICTLMEGKGKLKDICVVCANALLPYIIVRFIATMLSWVLAGEEEGEDPVEEIVPISDALAAGLDLGQGSGPLMHNFDLKEKYFEEISV